MVLFFRRMTIPLQSWISDFGICVYGSSVFPCTVAEGTSHLACLYFLPIITNHPPAQFSRFEGAWTSGYIVLISLVWLFQPLDLRSDLIDISSLSSRFVSLASYLPRISVVIIWLPHHQPPIKPSADHPFLYSVALSHRTAPNTSDLASRLMPILQRRHDLSGLSLQSS